MKSFIYKDGRGWVAQTDVVHGDRVLRIYTGKRSNGQLATTVTAGKSDGIGFSFIMFQDYNKVVMSSDKGRCTEKSVRTQHDLVLDILDTIRAEVDSFYTQEA